MSPPWAFNTKLDQDPPTSGGSLKDPLPPRSGWSNTFVVWWTACRGQPASCDPGPVQRWHGDVVHHTGLAAPVHGGLPRGAGTLPAGHRQGRHPLASHVALLFGLFLSSAETLSTNRLTNPSGHRQGRHPLASHPALLSNLFLSGTETPSTDRLSNPAGHRHGRHTRASHLALLSNLFLSDTETLSTNRLTNPIGH